MSNPRFVLYGKQGMPDLHRGGKSGGVFSAYCLYIQVCKFSHAPVKSERKKKRLTVVLFNKLTIIWCFLGKKL